MLPPPATESRRSIGLNLRVRQNEKAIVATSRTLAANIRMATASVRRTSVDMTSDPPSLNQLTIRGIVSRELAVTVTPRDAALGLGLIAGRLPQTHRHDGFGAEPTTKFVDGEAIGKKT
jgi:hypothetical protein